MPPARRILSLWLPRFAAEWRLRRIGAEGAAAPFATVAEGPGGGLALASVAAAAEAAGLGRGMALADARAILPDLVTRPAEPEREAAALIALARWAGRWSPFVGVERGAEGGPGDGLALDATGVAHLFGGEAAMAAEMVAALERMGFSARAAAADTRGAAWALALFGGGAAAALPAGAPDGDAVASDAPATRVRTPKRRARPAPVPAGTDPFVAPVGGARAALGPLPVAALRLRGETVERLHRLGLRRVEDLLLAPRAGLARRFGTELPLRIDQALGMAPEPISPVEAAAPLAVRVSFPEPIGLLPDVEAAAGRLLERLGETLARRGLGARRLRFALRLAEGGWRAVDLGLARPGRDAAGLLRLLAPKLAEIEVGFGADAARLSAPVVEPWTATRPAGWFEAQADGAARIAPGGGAAFADLLTRLGGRIGLERLIRPLPAESHIPEKAWIAAPAAYSEPPEGPWPDRGLIRPLLLLAPEPLTAEAPGRPPARFRWRRRLHALARAEGPERIAPEWWLDDPAWRSGPRDYWAVEDEEGRRLWLFEALGGEMRGGWFVAGEMA